MDLRHESMKLGMTRQSHEERETNKYLILDGRGGGLASGAVVLELESVVGLAGMSGLMACDETMPAPFS